MEKRVLRIAVGICLGVFLLAVLWPYEQSLQNWAAEPDYEVLEGAELFFNNTRITAYQTEETEELQRAGFKVHRSAKALRDTTYPVVNYAIINHWRADRAYIIAEPNRSSKWLDTNLLVFGDTSLRVAWSHMDYEAHYALAASLFEAQLQYHRIWLVEGQDSLLLFGTQGNEKANRTVLKDYFRLIGRFK